jgi:chromosome segregation ATPase
MGEHYDMTQSVSLDKYNEVLCELDEKNDKISELEEDIKYYKEKTNNLNNLIKELYRELKRKDAKDI